MLQDDDSQSAPKTPRPGSSSEVEQLRTLLYTDDLTNLYNRRFFRHCVAEQKTQSDSANAPFALLMMDVDHFKQINDTYGHAVGDAALIRIARALREEFREQGWVFRYAGDEFVGILREGSEEKAKSVCSRILNRVSVDPAESDPSFPIKSLSMSIGYAMYPSDSASISDLMEQADRALYASKQAGRNSYHSASEISAKEQADSREWPIKVACQSLVGRQPQWNQLQHHFNECKNGRGRMLFVVGEAGIGKSRLLRHFTKRQRASDFHILYGECTEGTSIHSYAPVRDALKKGFEAKDPQTVNTYKSLDENCRKELVAFVPQFDRFERSPLPPAASTDRFFLLESIYLLLQALSRQLPTIMVLEDIHWSDEATLNLLQYVARNIANERILVIATFRDEEAVHSHLRSVIQNMSRENLFETITLKPLNAVETGQMVQEIFTGYNVTDGFKQWIYEETEGIPFYTEELINLLLEEGYIERYGRDIEVQKPDKFILPYSIRALIQRRLNRLSESMQRVLGYASIIGYEFDFQILVRLIEENEGFLIDVLEQLSKMLFVREIATTGEERFGFVHNKIRDVIYEDMGIIKRRKFHRRVGEILEELHKNELDYYAEDLAHHFMQGNDWMRACLYSLEAGKKALQIHDYRNALQFFDRCFQFKGHLEQCPADKLAELYTNKGIALEAMGMWDDAIQCYEQLVRLKEPSVPERLEADALNYLSRVFYKREDFPSSLDRATKALEVSTRLNYQDGVAEAYYSIGKNNWRLCDYEKALQQMHLALEIANTQADVQFQGKLLNSLGVIYLEQGGFDKALSSFHQAQEVFQKIADKQGSIQCLVNISIVRHVLGDLIDARQHVVNAFAIAQEIGDPFSIGSCSVNQAELEYKLANYETAARLNERAGRVFNEIGYELGLTHYLENEAHLQAIKGNLQAALEAVLKALRIAQDKNLKKRSLELMKDQAAIEYFQGNYVSALNTLYGIIDLAKSIHATLFTAEANIKLGFTYLALEDQARSTAHWTAAIQETPESTSVNYLFWRIAAQAFLAASAGNDGEMRRLQKEMRDLAEKTQYATLITIFPLLSSMQYDRLGRPDEALEAIREAEKQARRFSQDLWMVRVRMKFYELQVKSGVAVSAEAFRDLMVSASEQMQESIVHRCYRLLYAIDPGVLPNWKKYWEEHKSEIPDAYHKAFAPPES